MPPRVRVQRTAPFGSSDLAQRTMDLGAVGQLLSCILSIAALGGLRLGLFRLLLNRRAHTVETVLNPHAGCSPLSPRHVRVLVPQADAIFDRRLRSILAR